MTNDRELLELAAKAAGVVFDPDDKSVFGLWLVIDREPSEHTRRRWNPLKISSDAFRLAVKLRITIVPEYFYKGPWDDGGTLCDPYAATRRAIVRAAAEIGRNMT